MTDLIERMKSSLVGVTDGPWDIGWYICRADSEDVKYEKTRKLKKGETRKSLKAGDELWRVPKGIGPIEMDHNHWSGNYLACSEEDANFIAAARTLLPEAMEEIEELRRNVRCMALDNMAATDQAAENHTRAEAAETALREILELWDGPKYKHFMAPKMNAVRSLLKDLERRK